jgi:hypothetical protein
MDRIARIASSARLEQQIEELLTNGLGDKREHLTELGPAGSSTGHTACGGRGGCRILEPRAL